MRPPIVIVLLGAGNVGSHFAVLAARLLASLGGRIIMVVVDPDVVSEGNVAAQDFESRDVGLPKSEAVARRLRLAVPRVVVIPITGPLEDLAAAFFAGIVILGLDSNAPRLVAARRTWLMGGRLVDCAVNGPAGLARVSTVSPSPEAGCLECSWDDVTYDALPALHGCGAVPPTNAPAALGALSASLGTLQLRRLLTAEGWPDASVEYLTDGERSFRTVLPRNPRCRCDHGRLRVDLLEGVDPEQSLGSLYDVLQIDSIRVPGFRWHRAARCEQCAQEQEIWKLSRGTDVGSCSACNGPLVALDYLSTPALARSELVPEVMAAPLSDVGIRPGEVVVGDDARQGLQLGDPFRDAARPALSPL